MMEKLEPKEKQRKKLGDSKMTQKNITQTHTTPQNQAEIDFLAFASCKQLNPENNTLTYKTFIACQTSTKDNPKGE